MKRCPKCKKIIRKDQDSCGRNCATKLRFGLKYTLFDKKELEPDILIVIENSQEDGFKKETWPKPPKLT